MTTTILPEITIERARTIIKELEGVANEPPNPLESVLQSIVLRCTHADDWGVLSEIKSDIITASSQEDRFFKIALELESLPILNDNIDDYPILFFYLSLYEDCFGWIPCYNAELRKGDRRAFVGIRYKDQSTDCVPCRFGYWAHCTADNTPSIDMNVNE